MTMTGAAHIGRRSGVDPNTVDVERLARFLYEHSQDVEDHGAWTETYEAIREEVRTDARRILRDFDELEDIHAEILSRAGGP